MSVVAAKPRSCAALRSHDGFVRILDVLLPKGGYLFNQVEVYFDESGSHSGSKTLCVAGYVIEKDQAVRLSWEWNNVLTARNLPYFHMVDCAHGNPPFDKLSKQDRVLTQARMIQIIKQYTELGLAITLDVNAFRTVPFHEVVGSAYTFCVHGILAIVKAWIRENPIVDDVVYIFEAGHSSQGEANRMMETIFALEGKKHEYRYGGHAFLPKEKSAALQAADLLAWQWYTDKRHLNEEKPRRKDCESLVKHPHYAAHVGRDVCEVLADAVKRNDVRELIQMSKGPRLLRLVA